MHSFDPLIGILQRELDLYERLNSLLEQEQEALTRLQVERLLQLTNEKECVSLQLKALDESRRLAMEAAAENLGLDGDAETLRLADLAERADGAGAEALRDAGARLAAAARQGGERNERVKFLADHSLKIVRESIAALVQPEKPQGTYRHNGALRSYGAAAKVCAYRA
ncbi:MAG: FlgN protein [candidate division BRC1 bacterium ADurb.BinA364]|nr:MAG: FlgN protein [candidate division BRC1 bacterium ADurb.BinA364]